MCAPGSIYSSEYLSEKVMKFADRGAKISAVENLIHNGATQGERDAARAAYERLTGSPYQEGSRTAQQTHKSSFSQANTQQRSGFRKASAPKSSGTPDSSWHRRNGGKSAHECCNQPYGADNVPPQREWNPRKQAGGGRFRIHNKPPEHHFGGTDNFYSQVYEGINHNAWNSDGDTGIPWGKYVE